MQHTIPRLELGAAVLAIQIDVTLIGEISADIFQSSVYWTDSMIVVVYLQVDSSVITHSWVIVLLESYHTLKPVNGDVWFNGPNSSHSRKVNGSSCGKLVPVLESDIEVKRNVRSYN